VIGPEQRVPGPLADVLGQDSCCRALSLAQGLDQGGGKKPRDAPVRAGSWPGAGIGRAGRVAVDCHGLDRHGAVLWLPSGYYHVGRPDIEVRGQAGELVQWVGRGHIRVDRTDPDLPYPVVPGVPTEPVENVLDLG